MKKREEVLALKFCDKDITLSMDKHINGCYFVFNEFPDYVDFISGIPGLGYPKELSGTQGIVCILSAIATRTSMDANIFG